MSKWFEADKVGLRQIAERLVERRGFGIIGAELYQNVMDTDATECVITIYKTPGRPTAILTVSDNDPKGFHDLTHAWTLYAPSAKKADPEKAGRFNLGEKYVLSFCRDASIHTTTGLVVFDDQGRKEYPRRKRDFGTEFVATIDCTTERLQQFVEFMNRLIVKPGLTVSVNGVTLKHRSPVASFTAKLPTEIADGEGHLKRTVRNCEVELHEVGEGEVAMLYELGIPVVETGDRWHYNVMQKVPLNTERDNVTPAYLRDLRAFVFNHTHNMISEEDTETAWVNEAAESDKATADAVETFRVKKFGEKSVSEDPFNPEANAEAMAAGYTVIPRHGLTPGQRDNLKRHNFLLSSTAAFPTAGAGAYSDDPDAKPVEPIPQSEWTEGMRLVHAYTERVATKLLGKKVVVEFVKVDPRMCGVEPWRACYGRRHLLRSSMFHFNVGVLGLKWFDGGVRCEVDELIIHELGHEYEGNHLSEGYYRGLCKLGARMKELALTEPGLFA